METAHMPPAFTSSLLGISHYHHNLHPGQQPFHFNHFLDNNSSAICTPVAAPPALDLCVRKRRRSPSPPPSPRASPVSPRAPSAVRVPSSPPRSDYQPPTPPTPPPQPPSGYHGNLGQQQSRVQSPIIPMTLMIGQFGGDRSSADYPPRLHEPPTTTHIEPTSTSMCFMSSPRSHSGSDSSLDVSDFSSSHHHHHQQVSTTNHRASSSGLHQKAKVPRPFKAYPKDPLSLTLGVTASTEALMGQEGTDGYSEFRNRMMQQVQASYSNGTNKNMRRVSTSSLCPSQNGDVKYMEMRRKNNEAAKRSRDARRAKEDEIAIRCAFLEQENLKLRYELAATKTESDRLRGIIAYSN